MRINLALNVNYRYGLNKVKPGAHWVEKDDLVKEVQWVVKAALLQQKIPKKPYENPVKITILYDDRLDIDNHGCLSKMIIDGLKGHVIKDDNRKYVKELSQKFFTGDGVVVEIEEIT